jgi:hypothetical protein
LLRNNQLPGSSFGFIHSGRKDFLPVEPQGGLSFLFRLSEPGFA